MVKYLAGSLDATFAALADPIRRGILERLAQGESSVGELARPFRVSAPAISRHLRVLEHAGLIERRKQGRAHRCRLRPNPINDASRWIDEQRAFWEPCLDALAEYLDNAQPEENDKWQARTAVSKTRSASPASSKPRRKKSSRP